MSFMAKPSCSDGKKRSRDEETHPDEGDRNELDGLEGKFTFTDTLIALRMMHAQFPKTEKVTLQPFTLQSQLYSSIKDRTQVDRDLELLKKEKILRLFKLNTGQDDHAIMFFQDYINQCVLLSAGGEMKDEDVTLLINAGLLTRQMIDPNMYWFSIPNIGSVLKYLSQGRKELLSFLNRRKYKEMLLAPLEKKCLRLSPLGMRFHLRDLIGSGRIKLLQSPSGMLVRASKD
ncbi:hypothetical protein KSP39_PZI012790 [Platanthera zijinensis]|uniref:Serine/threonine-protein kinase 19 n=1 Tax=Platanthera zijinensis TaxID=2320716 RepID=A0AAP0BG72_9ASPA